MTKCDMGRGKSEKSDFRSDIFFAWSQKGTFSICKFFTLKSMYQTLTSFYIGNLSTKSNNTKSLKPVSFQLNMVVLSVLFIALEANVIQRSRRHHHRRNKQARPIPPERDWLKLSQKVSPCDIRDKFAPCKCKEVLTDTHFSVIKDGRPVHIDVSTKRASLIHPRYQGQVYLLFFL